MSSASSGGNSFSLIQLQNFAACFLSSDQFFSGSGFGGFASTSYSENIGLIVLGLPVNMDGTEGPRCQSTRSFARNFARLSPIPIVFWDERLTTFEAENLLIEGGMSRKRRKQVIDKDRHQHNRCRRVSAGELLQLIF